MPLLLVDDRDGRIVAPIESEDQITRVLDGWVRSDGNLPEYLCLVELRAHNGELVGTETTIRIRPLQ